MEKINGVLDILNVILQTSIALETGFCDDVGVLRGDQALSLIHI